MVTCRVCVCALWCQRLPYFCTVYPGKSHNKMVTVVNDSVMVEFSKSYVLKLPLDPPTEFCNRHRPIKGFTGLSWTLRLHRVSGPLVRVTIGTSDGSVNATGTATVGTVARQFDVTFDGTEEHVVQNGSLNDVADQFFVTVVVKFEIPEHFWSFKMPSLNVFELVAGSEQDVAFRFTDGDIKVHRGFLSLISPVFQAMFTHDTKEAKSGVIEVSDFEPTTVKNVINYCYGQNTGVSSTSEVINMLRFADKYDIKAVVEKLEGGLESSVHKNNFCMIAQYAWDYDRDGLKTTCGKFYRQNVSVCLTPEFNQMSASTQLGVIATAASIESPVSDNE